MRIIWICLEGTLDDKLLNLTNRTWRGFRTKKEALAYAKLNPVLITPFKLEVTV